MDSILVANRGEIAIRVVRAARELGVPTVGVYARDDAACLHARFADQAHELPGEGAAAYLDQEAVLAVARASGCAAVHPGYGFLSENAQFARRCAKAKVAFIGPRPELLDLFGDKVRARELARSLDVPVMPATSGPITLAQARAFADEHGAVMLKAVAGGGGRGMRTVTNPEELQEAFERCRSEAAQAFGNDALYVEKLLPAARHIEVQVVGDGSGAVCQLGERDCTLQRRHQKLIEIAPSPVLDLTVRQQVLSAATRMAAQVRYDGLGTFEFLVNDGGFWFIEANPRLQVEHTVTEEVTGVDLVQTQIRLAEGASLADVGLEHPPSPTGFALQARVNLETLDADCTPHPRAGRLTAFAPPAGPQVRVDTYGYPGYRTSLRYDSLLAKVVTRGRTFAGTVATARRALGEFHVEGVDTNLALLASVLAHPGFLGGDYHTTFITYHLEELLDGARPPPSLAPPAPPADTRDAEPAPATAPVADRSATGPCPVEGAVPVRAPMAGMVTEIAVAEADPVRPGQRLLVLEAMKMEHVVRAEHTCTVSAVVAASGDAVEADAPLLLVEPAPVDGTADIDPAAAVPDEQRNIGWAKEVGQIRRRRQLAQQMGGTRKVTRQHDAGKLTARERVDLLADPGSFREIGTLTGFADYSGDELTSMTPANFVAGTAELDGRKVLLGVDDFTGRGGSGDAAIHAKQIFAEQYARDMRLPVVRLLDGASGGGSVKMAQEAGFHYLPVNPGWDAVVDNLALVPVTAACMGPTVGLGAARLVMSHLALLVAGVGQVFTAGPPVVRGGTGEDLTKEGLGGTAVHRGNGMVERVVDSEQEAVALLRGFLSYLPSSVFELPPVTRGDDPTDRCDESLLTAVPRNPRRPYPIWPILDAVFDRGSVFPYAQYGGSTVTALARLDGHPVGVLATDPFHGATMSVEGAQATTRLVDLCETFHLPIVSLTDQAGVAIGSAAERRGSIRHGARAIAAVYQARVPQAEVIVRRVFGVGGAGIVNRHRPGRSWSWPSGTWGSLPAEGGIEAAFRAQLDQAEDREQEIDRIRRELSRLASPFRTAERFSVQDIIDPRESRPLLCDWVRDAYRVLPELLGRPSFGTRP